MTELQMKEHAVSVLKMNGFGVREIQRLMGFRSPRSVTQHLERRKKQENKEPLANTAAVLLDALDSLGLALAEHNHQWASSLRDKYDNAVGLLVGKTSLPSGHQQTKCASAGDRCYTPKRP
jgi:SOS-response transcriptional repressor LexA